jgi:N-acetylglutamate synthase-like GNAT family acetyltransferase
MAQTLYMVIEHFKAGDPAPVYRRFRERGRLAPDGLRYVASWVESSLGRCYQVMETGDRALLDQWIAQWDDLVDFEVHPVITSAEAAAKAVDAPAPYTLRAHQPGDMGWVVHRHGAIYAREWGYDAEFEALVARIAAHFLDHFDPARERCWIAERDGAIIGSVFLVRKSKTVAKLRLLLVEPHARGLGLGARLVQECVGFAREAGYRKVVLWTQSELDAARKLYQRAGFLCIDKKKHHSWGRKDLVSETWELRL